MKSLIIPVAIIVGLIVFFFFVDRKEFNRHDSIQNVQIEKRSPDTSQHIDHQHIRGMGGVTTETTSTASNPVEAEVKPAETKSMEIPSAAKSSEAVTELKPSESKPAKTASTAHVEIHSVESIVKAPPKESTPLAEPKSENKPAPAAVPVVTAAEAEKRNAEAKVFAEKYKRLMFFANKDMSLVYYDKMNLYTHVSIAQSFDNKHLTN